jgi:LysM domain
MYATGVDAVLISARRPPSPWPGRGRKLVLWFALTLLFVFGLATAAHGSAPAGYDTVTVGAGDTLWSIAAQRYPGDDTRSRVDQILRANGLSSPVVYPGEELRVPAG